MNISISEILAVILLFVSVPTYQAIRAEMKAQDIDAEIRKKLVDATYFIVPHVFDLLNRQYTPEQLKRVQPWIDQARIEITKKRTAQEANEAAMMTKYQAYVEAANPFEKCRLGRQLPKQWYEAARRTCDQLKYSESFKNKFEALLKDVRAESKELATQLYATYLANARAGDPIGFGKLRLLLRDFELTLKFPSDWSDLVGMFVECPDIHDYGFYEQYRHEDLICIPSAPKLRLKAIKAIDKDDAIAAKLCLAYADAPEFRRVPLEEELRVKLGQIVYSFNQQQAEHQQ